MKKMLLTFILCCLSVLSTTQIFTNDNDIIRAYLQECLNKGKTQKDLGEQLSVDPSTISRFVRSVIKNSPTILNNARTIWPNIFMQQQARPVDVPAADPAPLTPEVPRKVGKEEVEEEQSPKLDTLQCIETAMIYYPGTIKEIIGAVRIKKMEQAPIAIAYREEGDGKGAFFDHYTMQQSTNHPTHVAADQHMRSNLLRRHIDTVAFTLSYGANYQGKKAPDLCERSYEDGLLFIPGRTRDNEFDVLRTKHENNVLRQALLRGQPILAICAGSWQLWQAFGGTTKMVTEHCYGGGMVHVGAHGNIVKNVQIHRIAIDLNSLLASFMNLKTALQLPVNSLHWKAPDENNIPALLQIAARTVRDDALAPNSRTGNGVMNVENNTIEAFENKHGAPLLGVLWHPEAYNANDATNLYPQYHRKLLQNLAKAGDAYNAKRRMLREYVELLQNIKP